MLTAMRYCNKAPVELSTSHSYVAHRPHLAFSSAQVKYQTEWSPSKVFFYDFWHKRISEQVFVERFFVIPLSIAAF